MKGNEYGLLTKPAVRMTRYWPSSFFFFAFSWTKSKSWSITTEKIRKIFSRLDTLQNSRFFFSKSVKKSVKRGVRVFRAKIRTVLQSTVLTVQALSIKDL